LFKAFKVWKQKRVLRSAEKARARAQSIKQTLESRKKEIETQLVELIKKRDILRKELLVAKEEYRRTSSKEYLSNTSIQEISQRVMDSRSNFHYINGLVKSLRSELASIREEQK
jgi:DNA primase catalytic subunit